MDLFFQPSTMEPRMMVLAEFDVSEIPSDYECLFSYNESAYGIKKLFGSLGTMFGDSANSQCCLGQALKAAKAILENTGGRIVLFLSTLPNVNEGSLPPRGDSRISKEKVCICHAQGIFDYFIFLFFNYK